MTTDYAIQAAERWAELAPELDVDKLRTGIRFSRFSRERERVLAETLSPFGAEGVRSMEDFRVLALLARIDPEKTTATKASQILQISKAATAVRIERFAGDGLVERSTMAHDKRAVEVGITDEGRALAQRCARSVASAHEQLLGGLTAKQLSQLDSLMQRLG